MTGFLIRDYLREVQTLSAVTCEPLVQSTSLYIFLERKCVKESILGIKCYQQNPFFKKITKNYFLDPTFIFMLIKIDIL